MKISVIGSGYVGLVSGTCFAETGNDVLCIDNNSQKVKSLKETHLPIYEPRLNVLFERNIKAKRLCFSESLKEGLDHADIVFLALPTPEVADGSANLDYIFDIAAEIGKIITKYKIIVNKSTVPVGTADKVREIISQHTSCNFDVVSNPEFLREGLAVDDFLKPDRVVIGSSSERAISLMKSLYQPFVRNNNPIIIMDEKSAEVTKYAANAFLAMKITFMNEIANFCDKIGADVDRVREGISTDHRIGKQFLFPGIGYGGSCFPKDVKALQKSASNHDYDFKILDAVISVNERQKTILIPKLIQELTSLKDKTIAIWGLSFKPETDDIREAPSLYIIDALLEEKVQIRVFDPKAIPNVKSIYQDALYYASSIYDALKNVDALIICTEWSSFRSPDFEKMKTLMKHNLILDGRNVFNNTLMQHHHFIYHSIGRPKK